jgi:hypothetical protein
MLESDNRNFCGGDFNEDKNSSLTIDYKGDFFPCLRYTQSSLNNR